MVGDECLEHADDFVVMAEREIGVDPLLHRHQPEFLESGELDLGEALVGDVREGAPRQSDSASPSRAAA